MPNTALLWSGASGEEILQLWLQSHPEVQKRFRQSSEQCSRTNDGWCAIIKLLWHMSYPKIEYSFVL